MGANQRGSKGVSGFGEDKRSGSFDSGARSTAAAIGNACHDGEHGQYKVGSCSSTGHFGAMGGVLLVELCDLDILMRVFDGVKVELISLQRGNCRRSTIGSLPTERVGVQSCFKISTPQL